MVVCGLSKARPISCNDCPAFHRFHISVFCVAESFDRFLRVMNTILKQIFLMVLHRPIECTPLTVRNSTVGHRPHQYAQRASAVLEQGWATISTGPSPVGTRYRARSLSE